jgi:hypothetical protein
MHLRWRTSTTKELRSGLRVAGSILVWPAVVRPQTRTRHRTPCEPGQASTSSGTRKPVTGNERTARSKRHFGCRSSPRAECDLLSSHPVKEAHARFSRSAEAPARAGTTAGHPTTELLAPGLQQSKRMPRQHG